MGMKVGHRIVRYNPVTNESCVVHEHTCENRVSRVQSIVGEGAPDRILGAEGARFTGDGESPFHWVHFTP